MNGFALQKQGERGGTAANPATLKDRFLKLKDVQDLLGVSRSTLWRWTAEHGLKVVRVGDVVRIRESDLQTFLSRHETHGASVDATQTEATAGHFGEPRE